MTGMFQWLAAWLVILLILYGLSQTKAGHTIIYYTAWLLVVFMIVSSYAPISRLLTAGNIAGQQ